MSNPIGWCDLTINPITGCLYACEYCYARRFAARLAGRTGYPSEDPFQPTFHPEKIDQILKLNGEGKKIFLSSMGDWFSEGVEPEWVERVLQAVALKPDHHFLVLTKRPNRILEGLRFSQNLWLGVSVTEQSDIWRVAALRKAVPECCHKFVSFEPILGPIHVDLTGIEWAILGAQTGPGARLPEREWVDGLVELISQTPYLPIFMKANLSELYHSEPWKMVKRFPEDLA